MWWIVLIIIIVLLIGACVGLYIYVAKKEGLPSPEVEIVKNEEPRPIVREEVKGEPLVSDKGTSKLDDCNMSVKKQAQPTAKKNKYVKAVQEMSPEMKAIVFADIFNKKHFD